MSDPAGRHISETMPEYSQLFSVDADGEVVELQEEVCAVCEGDGYYMVAEWHHGEMDGWREVECLCHRLQRMEDEANAQREE